MTRVHITAAQAVTAIGLTAVTTTASVRAGIRRIYEHELYPDEEGFPLSVAPLPSHQDRADPFDRVAPAAVDAIRALMQSFDPAHDLDRPCHLLLGCAHPDRGGALFERPDDMLPIVLASELGELLAAPQVQVFPYGNPAALFALDAARELLVQDPEAVCIVGGIDSLLGEELLERLEEGERLKSEGYDNPHGMSPGEAVGLLVVEAAGARTSRRPLAVVEGLTVGHELHPYSSEQPSMYEGLTGVCRGAMLEARANAGEIEAVLIDLDGEHHRAHEWATVEIRCLGPRQPPRGLVHPAEGYGSIGAASAALLLAIVATSRGWLDGLDLVLASDDDGPCGAAVLRRQWRGH